MKDEMTLITEDYEDTLLFKELSNLTLTDEQKAQVLLIIENVCNFCYDGYNPCYCTNDS